MDIFFRSDAARALKSDIKIKNVKVKVKLASDDYKKNFTNYETKSRAKLKKNLANWRKRHNNEDDGDSSEGSHTPYI